MTLTKTLAVALIGMLSLGAFAPDSEARDRRDRDRGRDRDRYERYDRGRHYGWHRDRDRDRRNYRYSRYHRHHRYDDYRYSRSRRPVFRIFF